MSAENAVLTEKFEHGLKKNILKTLFNLKGSEYWIGEELVLEQISKEADLEDSKELLKVLDSLQKSKMIERQTDGQKIQFKLTKEGEEDYKRLDKDIVLLLDKERKLKVHPALDYNKKAFVGIYIPCLNGEDETEELCLIDDNSDLFPATKESLSLRNLRIDSYPAKFEPRWSFNSIKCFLGGADISAKDLFDSVKKRLQFYIDFPEKEAYDFFSLWIIGSYLHPVFQAYPYVYIGGLKESGKTKVLYLAYCMAFNSIFSSNMSASSLFRLIQSIRCTLLIDETEKLSNPQRAEEFRNILLGGYKSGSKVYRTEAKGRRELEVQAFEPYSPKMIANIRGLEDVLESRCISFVLKRTLNKEVGDREINEKDHVWQDIRDSLYVFALRHWKEIKEIYSSLENETDLKNREWELWKPILAVAKFVSEELFEEMKALAIRKASEQKTENITNTAEYVLTETLLEMVTENGYYSIKDITEAVRRKYEDEEKWLNNRWIGRALRRLGFSESRRLATQREIKLTIESIKDLAQRLGIEQSQMSETSQTTPNSNDISDASDTSDVANNKGICDFCKKEAEKLIEIKTKDDVTGKEQVFLVCEKCKGGSNE